MCPIYPKPIEPVEEVNEEDPNEAGSQEWLINSIASPPVQTYKLHLRQQHMAKSASQLSDKLEHTNNSQKYMFLRKINQKLHIKNTYF